MHPLQYRRLVGDALSEDLFYGDRTTDSIFSREIAIAELFAKEAGIVAGLPLFLEVFAQVDQAVECNFFCADGDHVAAGQRLAIVSGRIASILRGERTALNFMQRMSGIATMTGAAVQVVAGTAAKIVDTRKTTPGWRVLEKYAVRLGGGENHRFNLADMVMIKDNHIKGAGSISEAVARIRARAGFALKIEVEAASLADVREALACGVEIIMLDNMTVTVMREAVLFVDGRTLLEASGGIAAERLREVAETGVDLISLGYLTHSCRALDLSLKLQ
ncbi:MAG: putative nicotinate-nucleotide pyrophosphorylase (carboxylating) [Syntrophomonadaceae bacterium]|nr:putative nicotinate-nucleotide pyrophosphorylase (carboxylating) [Bacillota bacterium]